MAEPEPDIRISTRNNINTIEKHLRLFVDFDAQLNLEILKGFKTEPDI